jgi:hypothetical protein
LLDEFVYKEKPPITQPLLQPAENGKAREYDDTDPFIPAYMYDAMKEKRPSKYMLLRSCSHEAPFCS